MAVAFVLIPAVMLTFSGRASAASVIETVAGNGTFGYSGDSGLATSAELENPKGVAVDTFGNIYIADSNNNRIRKVDTFGNITTVAGNGTQGYSGDSGPATNAELNWPEGVAVDSAGNLYIADYLNNRIRKVDTSGKITTVAGNGTAGYSGDGSQATSAKLTDPGGIAVDGAGNLYIADTGNNRIRKVDTSGKITTVAGNGTKGYSGDGGLATNAELNFPHGVALDTTGNLYIADTGNNRIRKVDPSGHITTLAGNGTSGYSGNGVSAASAKLNNPAGVAVDGAGDLYIADTNNNAIRKVDTSDIITTIAGNGIPGYSGDGGPATSANLDAPYAVALNAADTDLYVADTTNNRIRDVTFNPLGLPGAPSITGFQIGNGEVTISFDPPTSDGGSPITGYIASCSASGQPTQQATGTGSPLAVTGLTNGVAYSCSVAATNANGNGTATDLPNSVTPHKANTSWLMLLLD